MKKILHINLEREWRGGERQTLLLAKGLRSRGWESEILARENSPLVEKAREAGISVKEAVKPFLRYSNYLKRFDLIHAHEVRGFQMAALSKWSHKKPLVYTRRLAKPPSQGLFTRIKYALADRVVAESKAVSKSINSVLQNCPTEVIHGAVDQESAIDCERVRAITNRFLGRKVVGCVAAMTREKGHRFLLESAAQIQLVDKDIIFVLLGDGPLRSELEAFAEATRLENVYFEGHVENVPEYMEVFDLLVVPSQSEAFVSVALDAFMMGIPVVATNVGGNSEIVENGINGVLVEYEDVQGFSKAVTDVLKDKVLLERYKEFARKGAKEKYCVERMVKEYERMYEIVLSRGLRT